MASGGAITVHHHLQERLTEENQECWGLKMLLAIKRDGEYLTPGVLNTSNKLDGERPYRMSTPQKVPGPRTRNKQAESGCHLAV